MTKKNILILSDIHVGHRLAVAPLSFTDSNGATYKANRVQRALYSAWQEVVRKWGNPDVLVVNGEPIDGQQPKDKGVETWTTNYLDQIDASVQLVSQFKAKKVYVTRGSNYHVEQGGVSIEEIFGERIRAEKVEGKYVVSELFLDVEDVMFNMAHHVAGSASGWMYRSVDYTSMTPIMDAEGHIRITEVGEYIDECLDGGRDYSQDKVLSFNKEGKTIFSPIKRVYRHEQQEDILHVEAKYGREIKLTGNHSIFTELWHHENGSQLKYITLNNASNLTLKDRVLIPQSMPEGEKIEQIDLLTYLWDSPRAPWISIEMDEKLRERVYSLRKLLKGASAPYTALAGGRITIDLAKKLGISMEEISMDCRLGPYNRKNKSTPRIIKITPEFCTILGYYLAEGYLEQNSVAFTFGKTDDEDEQEFVSELALNVEMVFGIRPIVKTYTQKNGTVCLKVLIQSSVLKEFWPHLGFGPRAIAKRMPDIMFNTTVMNRSAFIDAYVNGDGWYNGQIGTVNMSTASKSLAYDLLYFLHQDGITGSIYEAESKGFAKGLNHVYYNIWFKPVGEKRKMREINKDLAFVMVKGLSYTRPTSIFVYDFSIGEENDTDNFVANGIVCHNSTPPAKEMMLMQLSQSKKWPFQVMIRSHNHYYWYVGSGSHLALLTPCWELQTWYNYRKSSAGTIPDIGAVRFTVEDGEYTWKPLLFKLEEARPPKVKL